MIRILCNTYTEDEVTMLFHIIRTAEMDFLAENCHSRCDECKYRKVCYDLEKARSHMRDLKEMVEW